MQCNPVLQRALLYSLRPSLPLIRVIKKKMSVDHCRNDADKEKTKRREKRLSL